MANAMRRSGDKIRRKRSGRPESFIVPTNGSVGCRVGSGKDERGAGFRLGHGNREADSAYCWARSFGDTEGVKGELRPRTPRKRFNA